MRHNYFMFKQSKTKHTEYYMYSRVADAAIKQELADAWYASSFGHRWTASMATAGAMAWSGWWERIGVLVSCSCRHLQNPSSSAWIMVRAYGGSRELHEAAGGAEQHHADEHSSDGFRRDGHGVYKLQDTVILMMLAS
jgi:hypothetical protein